MLGKGLASLIPSRNDDNKKKEAKEQGVRSEVEKKDKEVKTPLIEEKEVHSVPPAHEDGSSSFSSRDKDAVMGDELRPFDDAQGKRGEAVFHIEIDKICPNPYQPRRNFDEESLKELAHSIQEYGIIQPLVVSRIQKESASGTDVEYQVIAGERRLRAAKIAGLPRVPVVVRKEETPKGNLEVALVENLQRSDLNPIETARAYSQLQDEFALTQREIAQRVGKSREAVANTLRLLNLSSEIQDSIASGKIGESQARVLLAIKDLDKQKAAFEQLLKGGMSVRTLKEKVRGSQSDPEKSFYEKQLEEKIGAPVQLSRRGDKGKVVIRFFSEDEMDGVFKRLLGDIE